MNIYNKFRLASAYINIALILGMAIACVYYLPRLHLHHQQITISIGEMPPAETMLQNMETVVLQADGDVMGLSWSLGILGVLLFVNQLLCMRQSQAYRTQAEQARLHGEGHAEPPEFIDNLTGLYTRQALEPLLAHELARAKRTEGNATVLLIEMDQFQNIRDSQDKANTQHAVNHIAQLLKQQSRRGDFVFRIKEGQFLIYLSDCKAQFTINAAERFRNAIEKSSYEHKGHALELSISVGIAASTSNYDIEQLKTMAAEALAGAQQGGGNCSVLHTPA